ncbi:uncharacterized protein RCC_09326 [Ramularia collo-cygni]|uniref:C-x8-C-x5-C-x3-H type zinc finger protein n=1 Tax=Ramularia collo-cygni TaxID=112498 RepID=A0A2D3VEU6_9PEZI|nr:uncharacterized protein RCC_09326 [Ramularia collo-cygni]CZT23612.1 uncharacterized protein RCC_09326 [Ramularia collo-cygni]
MAPSALGPSLPDIDSPVRKSLDPVGTPRRSGSMASTTNTMYSLSNPGGSRTASRMSAHMPSDNGSAASAANLWARYTQIKDMDVAKNMLLEEVITRYAYLQQLHNNYLQATEQQLAESNVNELRRVKEMNSELFAMLEADPFVLVLIDGDGMIFDNYLLRLGEDGGRQAANLITNAVDAWMPSHVDGYPSNCRIVTRVYANVKGLADTCTRAGIVSSPTIIEDFVRGFTRSDDYFDFVDVGSGKDRADVKLNALLKLHVRGHQCRHILFGCSHDNGYARILEKYSMDQLALRDITLLEGVPFEKELVQLPHNKTKFPGIFRDTKININGIDLLTENTRTRHDSRSSFNPASGVFTPFSQTPARTPPAVSSRLGPRVGSPALSIPIRDTLTRSSSVTSSSALSEAPANSNGNGGAANGWASIAAKAAHRPLQELPKPAPEPKLVGPVVRQNKLEQRLDPHMDYDHDRVYELKKLKLCNQHYIGRGCCHHQAGNGACPHKHDHPLSAKDTKWLRVVARETVCKKGTACLDFDCIYGHHCPYPKANEGSMRGIGCINGDACRFAREMHGMDMTVAKTIQQSDMDYI